MNTKQKQQRHMTLEIQTKHITKMLQGYPGKWDPKPPLLITGSPTEIRIHVYKHTMNNLHRFTSTPEAHIHIYYR